MVGVTVRPEPESRWLFFSDKETWALSVFCVREMRGWGRHAGARVGEEIVKLN